MRFLLGASLIDFRCFDGRHTILFDHLTVISGPNNSGKSALLGALRRLVSVDLQRHTPKANPAGAMFLGPNAYFSVQPADRRDHAETTQLEIWIGDDARSRARPDEDVALPIDILAEFTVGAAQRIKTLSVADDRPQVPFHHSDRNDNDAVVALQLLPRLPVIVIPEERRLLGPVNSDDVPVREELVEPHSLHADLLTWLCEGQSKFAEWEELVSKILGVEFRARLTPTATLAATTSSRFRDVSNLGAGIREVASFARALIKFNGGLLLYEEPELHLHPTVQRRLMEELLEHCRHGRWQAIVCTHSPHVLDLDERSGVAVYAVARIGDRTHVLDSAELATRRDAIEALGARPSSLLQANAVIWVEGPSDALYLRHFLEVADNGVRQFSEYRDYTFAFFGGALLAHASAGVAPIPQLVHLLSIHPNSFVVVNSDRATADGSLGKKYTAEFLKTAAPERVWVTEGREFENYLSDEIVVWAVTGDPSATSHLGRTARLDRSHAIFSTQVQSLRNAIGCHRCAHDASDGNKVPFARAAVELMKRHTTVDWLKQLDLRERLAELAGFIDQRNRGA